MGLLSGAFAARTGDGNEFGHGEGWMMRVGWVCKNTI